MIIKELVQQVKGRVPAQLGKIPDAKAASLLREAFALIRDELAKTDQGMVKVGGLGNFRIRLVEVENDGKTETVKRITFVPAPQKKDSLEESEAEL